MKDPHPRLGDLELQVAFRLPQRKTIYITITYPSSFANPHFGSRACYNLRTRKAENIACKQKIEIIPLYSEVSESKE
jgi:hypothetical protein